MIDIISFSCLHKEVSWLMVPALVMLLIGCAIALVEAGIAVVERLHGLAKLRAGDDMALVQSIARRRLERADLLARIPPMLGLNGNHHLA